MKNINILLIFKILLVSFILQHTNCLKIKKLIKQQIQGSCGAHTTITAGPPYHYDYTQLGGSSLLAGVTEMTATFWLKVDTESYNNYRNIWLFQKGTVDNLNKQIFSISYNSYHNYIQVSHNLDSDTHDHVFTSNKILSKGSWVFITVSISEDDQEIFLSGYYPNYTISTGNIYFTQISHSQSPSVNPVGFDFSDLHFYAAIKASGIYFNGASNINYQTLCGSLQDMDLIVGYYVKDVYTTYNYLHQGSFGSSYFGNTELLNLKFNRKPQNSRFIQDLSQYQNKIYSSLEDMVREDGAIEFRSGRYLEFVDSFKFQTPYFIDTDYQGSINVLDSVSFTISYQVYFDLIVKATIIERYDKDGNLLFIISHHLDGSNYQLKIEFYVLNALNEMVATVNTQILNIPKQEWHRVTLMFYNGQFANQASVPMYNFFLTAILDQNAILNNVALTYDSTFKNSFLLQKSSDIIRIGTTVVDPANTGSFRFRELQIYSGVQLLLDTHISDEISNCSVGIIIDEQLQCIQCESTYVLVNNVCQLTCFDASYDQITEPDYCVQNNVCNYKCTTCDPLEPDVCLTCTGAQRDMSNDCICNPGYFDVFGKADCQQFIQSQNYTMGTFTMSVNSVTAIDSSAALNAAKTNGTYSQEVQFEKPLHLLPEYLAISFIQWVKTDNEATEFEISYIPETLTRYGFTAQLDLYNNTKLDSITFQYITSDDYFYFRTGVSTWTYYSGNVVIPALPAQPYENFNGLAIDNESAQFVDIVVSGLPWSANVPFTVLTFVQSFRDIEKSRNSGYFCQVITPSVPGPTITFTIRLNRIAGSRAKQLSCGYVVVPTQLVSTDMAKVFTASEYVYSLDPSPLKGFATTTYQSTITSMPSLTEQFFIPITYLNQDDQNSITGQPIQFGFRTSPRNSNTNIDIQAITDNNKLFQLNNQMIIPVQICHHNCGSCQGQYNDHYQNAICVTCNPTLDPTNRLLEPPFCGCISDFYEDISDGLCYECTNVKCDQCYQSVDKCLECTVNRIHIPGVRETSGPPACDCLPGERSYLFMDSPYCGNCEIAQPLLVELSKDYTVIKIMFDFEVDIVFFLDQLNAQSKMREPLVSTCDYLFDGELIELLGIEPKCYLGQDNDGNVDHAIIISIGAKPLIFPEETVVFNPNTLRDRNLAICDIPGRTDSFNEVRPMNITYSIIPAPLPDPIVELNVPENPVTICPELKLSLKKVYNDLSYGVKFFTWKFLSITPQNDVLLDKLNNELAPQFLNQKSFNIPQMYLAVDSTYEFELYFKTYMTTENTQTFTFQTEGTEGVTTFIEQQNFDLYIYQDVSIIAQYLHFKCDQGTVETLYSAVTSIWTTESGNPIGIDKNEERLAGLTYSFEQYEPFVAQVNTENIIKVLISVPSGKSAFATQKLRFLTSDITVQMQGGSRIHAYQKVLEMRTDVKDPDINPAIADPQENITLQWECKKMENLSEDCVDYTQENLLIDTVSLENQFQFDIPGRRMEPYKIYQFKLYGQKPPKEDQEDLLVIIAQELDLPALSVDFPIELLQKKVNLNEEIFTTINYAKEDEYDPSILQYSATILYEFEARSTEVFDYKKTRLKVWEHFVDFKREDLLQIRYTVYNPFFMMPSTSMINIRVNIPAYNCTISAEGTNYSALDDPILLQAIYCVDSDQPLTYKYFFYQSEEEYEQERIQPINQKRLILTDFLPTNKFTTFLPQSKYEDKQQIIVINVVDSAGGMNNLTVPIQMVPNINTDQNLYVQNINNKINEAKMLELNDQIRYYCIITEDLSLNQNIDPKSQQIVDLKKSLIFELNIIKNSILPSSELDAQIAKALDILNEDYESILGTQNSQEISKMLVEQQEFLTVKQEQGNMISLNTRSLQQTMSAEKVETIVASQLKIFDSVLKGTNLVVNRTEIPYIQNSQDNANEKVFNMTAQASDTSLANMMPNQKSKLYDGGTFKLKSQKITKKNINSYLGTEPSWSGNDDEETSAGISEDTENPVSNDDEFFVGFKEFKTNPFASSDLFHYNDTGIPVKDPEIKKSGSNKKINITAPITHDFDINEENSQQPDKLVCISKDSDNKWDAKKCQSKVYEDEDGNTKAKCVCKDLSVATIVNDADDIFADSYIDEVFSNQGFDMLLNFKFWEDPIFYMLLTFSIIIIVSMVYGYKLDQKALQELKVYPINEEEFIEQIRQTQKTEEDIDGQEYQNMGEFAKNVEIAETKRGMLQNLDSNQISNYNMEMISENKNPLQSQKNINDITPQNQKDITNQYNQQENDILSQKELIKTQEDQQLEEDQKKLDDLVKSLDIKPEENGKNTDIIKEEQAEQNSQNQVDVLQQLQKSLEEADEKKQQSDISPQKQKNSDSIVDKSALDEKQQLTQNNEEENQGKINKQESINVNNENSMQKSSNQLQKQDSVNPNEQLFDNSNFQQNQIKLETQQSQQIDSKNISSNENEIQKENQNNNNTQNLRKLDFISNENLIKDLKKTKNSPTHSHNSVRKPSQFKKSKSQFAQRDIDSVISKNQQSNKQLISIKNDDQYSVYSSRAGNNTNRANSKNQKKKTQHLIIYEEPKKKKKKNTVVKEGDVESQQNKQNTEKNENVENNQEEDEEEQKKKLKLSKKYSILEGIYLYHSFFGIYFTYDPKMSRPVRFSIYYLKILLVMTVTGLFASNQADQFMGIVLSVIGAILAGIPLAICKSLITNSNIIVKSFGILVTATAYGTCFYAITIIAILMKDDDAVKWQTNYLTSVLIDNAVSQPLMVALKLKLFNISIGTRMEQPIRSLFAHFGSFFAED